MIVESSIKSSLVNCLRRHVAVDLQMKRVYFTKQEVSTPCGENVKFTFSSFGDSSFQKLA